MNKSYFLKAFLITIAGGFLLKTPEEPSVGNNRVLQIERSIHMQNSQNNQNSQNHHENQNNITIEDLAKTDLPDSLDERFDPTPANILIEKITGKNKKEYSQQTKKFYPENFIALLINASENPKDPRYAERYRKNIDTMITTLRQIGVSDKNIYVLDAKSGFPGSKPATIQNLYSTIYEIQEKAGADNLLIRYITNHGFKEKEEDKVYFSFEGEELDNKIFSAIFTNTDAGGNLSMLAPCKSYTSINTISNNEVIYTFTGPEKNAVGYGTQNFAKTILNLAKNKDMSQADFNKDGELSFEEAAIYTAFESENSSLSRISNYSPEKGHSQREVPRIAYSGLTGENIILIKKPQH